MRAEIDSTVSIVVFYGFTIIPKCEKIIYKEYVILDIFSVCIASKQLYKTKQTHEEENIIMLEMFHTD